MESTKLRINRLLVVCSLGASRQGLQPFIQIPLAFPLWRLNRIEMKMNQPVVNINEDSWKSARNVAIQGIVCLGLIFVWSIQTLAQVDLQISATPNNVIQSGNAEVLGDLLLVKKTTASAQTTLSSTLSILYQNVPITNLFSGSRAVNLSNLGIIDTDGITIRMTGGWLNTGITAQVTNISGSGGQITFTIPAGLSISDGDAIRITGVRGDVSSQALNVSLTAAFDQAPSNAYTLTVSSSAVASTKSGMTVSVVGAIEPICSTPSNPMVTLTEGFAGAFVQYVPVDSFMPISPRSGFGATHNTQIHLVVTGLPSGVSLNWPDTVTASVGPGTLRVYSKTSSEAIYQYTTTDQSNSDSVQEVFTLIPQVAFAGSVSLGEATVQLQLYPASGTSAVPRFNDAMQPSLAPALVSVISCNPPPALSSITPTSITAGSSPITLVVTGSNFLSGSVVRWNLSDRATTYVSDTVLRAVITQADLATAGTASVMVWNPPPGGGISIGQTFTINAINPVPTITTLNPASVTYGGQAFLLDVVGINFVPGTVLRWNGAPRPTTVVSSTEVRADISAADIASVGSVVITVFNPAPQGGESNPLPFSITYVHPAPTLTSLNPTTKPAGSSNFQLILTGTNFVVDSKVRWNGQDRTTTYVSDTELRAAILSADLPGVGTASVTVYNPPPGGGTSSSLLFTIDNPLPAITSLTPSTVTAGSAAQTLTVKGINFVNGSVVCWNGANRTTTFVSTGQLTAVLPSSDFQTAQIARVTVVNLPTGGGTSNPEPFSVTNQVPAISGITPAAALVGTANVTVVINGSKFIADSKARWNGQERTTTYVNSSQLRMSLNASDLSTAGTFSITVANPDPGGGTSTGQTFTVNNPLPSVTSINPSSTTVGSDLFTLTVNGANLINGSVVRWNGADLATTYVSSGKVTAAVPAKLVATVGASTVTVFNATPGGGLSNGLPFQINNPVPAISKLSPASVAAGGSGITLSVQGSNFVTTSKVRWNGTDQATKYVSATELTVSLNQTQLAVPAVVPIVVFNPTPGGGASSTTNFTITVPPPTISALAPTSALAGGAAFTLSVTGTKFVSTSKVRWDGQDRTTQFISSTKLSASIQLADIAVAGAIPVTVVNPDPGGTSEPISFTVNNPIATISKADPAAIRAGDAAFTLTLTGTNFVEGSIVQWNGADRATTRVSATQVKANIIAEDFAKSGSVKITVFNPTPGGGVSSAFSYTIGNALPVISTLAPVKAVAGGAGFTLTVNGRNFAKTAKVRWNGLERTTVFVSETQLTATILASDISTVGVRPVTVLNVSGDTPSTEVSFTVEPLQLSSITLASTSIKGGSPVAGTVSLNGAAAPAAIIVTLSSSNRQIATLPASVTIPAGALSVNFTVTTSSLETTAAVVLSASYGTVSKRVTLAVGQKDIGDSDPAATLFVPVILVSSGVNNSYYTTALSLANTGSRNAILDFSYFGAFGSTNGSVSDVLVAGQQRIQSNALNYLISLGLQIPESGNRGGTLRIRCWGISSAQDIAVTARTTTAVSNGRAGLAYQGLDALEGMTAPSFLYGLRQNAHDRSNVALQNMGGLQDGDIVLNLTVYSGDLLNPFSLTLPSVSLPPGGFLQLNEILVSNGMNLSNGFVRVEKISGAAPYYAYAVINDQVTSDGSFIPPIPETAYAGRSGLTLPVIVETPSFSSEIILTNSYGVTRNLQFTYVSSANQTPNGEVSFSMPLHPAEQVIIPGFIQYLRNYGINGIPPSGLSQAGALFVTTDRGSVDGIFVGARTSLTLSNGGQYGLFYPATPYGSSAGESAWLFGLQQNLENRTNLAIINTGENNDSIDVFNVEIYDGETGQKKGLVEGLALAPRQWKQLDLILDKYSMGVRQGYARVLRTGGSNPFVAYAVVNDGGEPGARTGDGSFIPMSIKP